MSIKLSGGVKEDGIVVGNVYDKYNSQNFIVKRIMKGFDSALETLVDIADPQSIHEVGCGEGYWVIRWNLAGFDARGSDFSNVAIRLARENAKLKQVPDSRFREASIYDLTAQNDTADLIVCCEVLEHVEDPKLALEALRRAAGKYLVLSVPREPLWRVLNVIRGKYLSELGNTPGHIQHWSKSKFLSQVSEHFEIVKVLSPLPWTMILCRPLK